jgi:hypothetical protein
MAGASKTERMPWKTSSVMEEKLKFVLENIPRRGEII